MTFEGNCRMCGVAIKRTKLPFESDMFFHCDACNEKGDRKLLKIVHDHDPNSRDVTAAEMTTEEERKDIGRLEDLALLAHRTPLPVRLRMTNSGKLIVIDPSEEQLMPQEYTKC